MADDGVHTMLKTVQGIVDETGRIKLLESVPLSADQRVLVTLLDDAEDDQVGGLPVTALLAESVLSDWLRPEEDEAWKEFQPKR